MVEQLQKYTKEVTLASGPRSGTAPSTDDEHLECNSSLDGTGSSINQQGLTY